MWDDAADSLRFAQQLEAQQQQIEHEQRMELVVEEAFEVQAFQPFYGWVFERFCDRSGNTFPALSAAAASGALRARDDKLNAMSDADVDGMEIGVLPSDEWMWSHPWIQDFNYTQCDEEGWSYGSTIARINRRLAEGTSKAKREYYHFVRRRRWIRTRIKKPLVCEALGQAAELAATGSGATTTMLDAPLRVERRKRYYRVYRSSLFHHFRLDSTPALSQFVKTELADEDIEKEGWLGQRGSFSRTWKLRYFILRRDTSSLVCLRDRASLVQISEAPIDRHTSLLTEESPNDHQFQFLVINGQHKLRLNAVDATSRAAWLSSLSELIWYNPVTTASITEAKLGATPTSTWDVVKRRRVWRPYRLVSSTMLPRGDVDRLSRQTYLEAFEQDFTDLLSVAKVFLKENLDVLEGNLFASEALFTAVVAKYAHAIESHFGSKVKLEDELAKEEQIMAEDSTPDVLPDLSAPTEAVYLDKLRSNDVQHTEVKFSCEIKGAKHDFRCVSFFAAQFHSLRALLAIQNDTNFLSRAGVIDYSLIIVGLIDYLHQFDFLKKMESTSKASLTFRDPTIISPLSYQRRFVNAMHRYLVGIELELELRIRKPFASAMYDA
ncbi:hypothetical protein ATCC90586_003483 [Pythium insidiosum]|nr:hypothetical protein ATCC90586_003483 [Pythium insidiosum]